MMKEIQSNYVTFVKADSSKILLVTKRKRETFSPGTNDIKLFVCNLLIFLIS
jgi:hypothetical protein